jgi:NNMT/PNMT/TEMT family
MITGPPLAEGVTYVSVLQGRANATKMVTMSSRVLDRTARNSQVDWSKLDAVAYAAKNYRTLRDDDQEVIRRAATFFAAAAARAGSEATARWQAVDVGTGSNLYPAFAMLPFAKSVHLLEYSRTSVSWLRRQRERGFDPMWDTFLDEFRNTVEYKSHFEQCDARAEFRKKAKIQRVSVFKLKKANWDLGTMFFSACSLSTSTDEFVLAVRKFVEALRPGAPFVAAFMLNSGGYQVGDHWFPAVVIREADVAAALSGIATRVDVQAIDTTTPMRPGVGMALATGYAG